MNVEMPHCRERPSYRASLLSEKPFVFARGTTAIVRIDRLYLV
jgi:hypothetical protein